MDGGGQAADLARRIADGDRAALSRGITLVESRRPDHAAEAALLVQALLPKAVPSLRVGVSGPPGAGKSTFIEALGTHAVAAGRRVAVLAVDPSSARTGGSILGDKTRMENLGRADAAYIRPSPSAGLVGGIAHGVRESVTLCEAAGFDLVLIETMGVGQAEIAVRDVTDAVALLVLPGSGDELQGIKRGIVEIADFLLVNKADGELADAAGRTAADYRNALRLLSPPTPGWTPEVATCSALGGDGVPEAWERLGAFRETVTASGFLAERRAEQAVEGMWSQVNARLRERLRDGGRSDPAAARLEKEVRGGRTAPAMAAETVLDALAEGAGSGTKGR